MPEEIPLNTTLLKWRIDTPHDLYQVLYDLVSAEPQYYRGSVQFSANDAGSVGWVLNLNTNDGLPEIVVYLGYIVVKVGDGRAECLTPETYTQKFGGA